jgi:hypothetical protein
MAASPSVGTLAWVRETRGLLRNRDRFALLGQACLYGLATLPWEVRRALGIRRRGLAHADVAALAPPDSGACREAEQLVAEMTSPMVQNHSHRTYAWGAALAAHDRLDFDREAAYLAALLHDLYWDDPTALPGPHCFTLPAADQALALCAGFGWDQARAEATADAITSHLNVWPPQARPEAYVVFVGARLDVVGYRYWDLDDRTIDAVLDRHPRLDLKRQSYGGFDAQARANPGSRVHFHTRYLAAKWFTRHAPFDE